MLAAPVLCFCSLLRELRVISARRHESWGIKCQLEFASLADRIADVCNSCNAAAICFACCALSFEFSVCFQQV